MLARGAGCSPTSVGDGKALALPEHAAQDLPEQVEGLRDAGVAEAVVHCLSIAARDDQPLVAEDTEMPRKVALPQADALDERAYRARPVAELVDDQEPGRVGQCLTEMRVKLIELLLRLLRAHVGSVSPLL